LQRARHPRHVDVPGIEEHGEMQHVRRRTVCETAVTAEAVPPRDEPLEADTDVGHRAEFNAFRTRVAEGVPFAAPYRVCSPAHSTGFVRDRPYRTSSLPFTTTKVSS
jgi:hypothetical protein